MEKYTEEQINESLNAFARNTKIYREVYVSANEIMNIIKATPKEFNRYFADAKSKKEVLINRTNTLLRLIKNIPE